jgi:ribosome-binding protein aMBF1 (putative translation factor)
MADRQSWSKLKRSRPNTPARRDAYRSAKEAFELAERVRRAREKLGVTQAELATRIGSTQPAVARLEAGGVSPSVDTLQRIADALGLELVVELRTPRRASA